MGCKSDDSVFLRDRKGEGRETMDTRGWRWRNTCRDKVRVERAGWQQAPEASEERGMELAKY